MNAEIIYFEDAKNKKQEKDIEEVYKKVYEIYLCSIKLRSELFDLEEVLENVK